MNQIGTVKRFNKIKGYGFLVPEGHDNEVFVHFSEVQTEGYKELQVGDHVSYTLNQSDKGEFATQVHIID